MLRSEKKVINKRSVDRAGMAASEMLEGAANAIESREVGARSSKAQSGDQSEQASDAQDFPEDQVIVDDW